MESTSLHTSIEDDARQIIEAKNQAARQPSINLQIAQAYLQHADPVLSTRTWQDVFERIASTKMGAPVNAGPLQFVTMPSARCDTANFMR